MPTGREKKMEIYYKSTRDDSLKYTASQAILQGLAPDGGLFVPNAVPRLRQSLSRYSEMSYREIAYDIMSSFFTDFTEDELKSCIDNAYDSKFDTEEIAPVKKAGGAYFLELFHGKTIAFKDMALSILPHLMTVSAKKNGEDKCIVILTATSGDTGKAALAGFADVPGTKIVVFYPKNGVSPLQERQMATQTGDNTKVIGITGNFDQAQTGVKKMFGNADLKERAGKAGYRFSSANSINIGRLVPQVVYYVHAYATLMRQGVIKAGDKINVTVPTGNFGNILAAYYAGKMGLPIDRLICASNSNKVLFDFFESGTYDARREFMLTMSPSMDILISSNLERLIYLIAGEDAARTASLMESLSKAGKYSITDDMKKSLSQFYAGYSSEEDTAKAIHDMFENEKYLMDPHTAVGAWVYRGYADSTGDDTPCVIASTASPFKFTKSVMRSIGMDDKADDMELADRLSEISGLVLPFAIEELKSAKIIHDTVCETEKMQAQVEMFLEM